MKAGICARGWYKLGDLALLPASLFRIPYSLFAVLFWNIQTNARLAAGELRGGPPANGRHIAQLLYEPPAGHPDAQRFLRRNR